MFGGQTRFVVRAALAVLSAGLFVVTLISREWIEVVFHVDPDRESGAVEWAIVGLTAVVAAATGLSARTAWRRSHRPRESAASA